MSLSRPLIEAGEAEESENESGDDETVSERE